MGWAAAAPGAQPHPTGHLARCGMSDEQVAIVTGAASGIGAGVTVGLAEAGYRVLAVDLAAEDLAAVSGRLGDGVTAHVADVRDAAAMQAVVTAAGKVDAFVACAGIADQRGAHDGDPDRWRAVLETNTLGPMLGVRACLPGILDRGHGDIVIVASASGRVTYVGQPAYVASKHGIVAFGDVLRKELAGTDVRVTLVEPGIVDTPPSVSTFGETGRVGVSLC